MATEALVTDQTAEGHVEEVKLTNDIKDATEDSCPEPKDLEGKDEENIKGEDAAAEEAPVTESKEAIVSEEKLGGDMSEPQADEVKINCPVTEKSKGKDEKTIKVEDSEVGDTSKQKQEDEKSECMAEEVENEEAKDETSKQDADSSTADSKEEAVSSAAEEPTIEAVIPEPPKQSIEAYVTDLDVTLVQESGSETAKEPAILEATVEEVNTTEELPHLSSEPLTEPHIASELVTEVRETLIDLKDEPLVLDSSKQEASGDVSETPIKELKEEGEGAVVTEEVPYVPELGKVNPSVSITTNPVTESVESLVKLEDEVEEEMQEKAVVAEEPTVTDTAQAKVEEKKDESLGGKNMTLVETSRDIDVQEGKTNAILEADDFVNKSTKKDDVKIPLESATNIGDTPKMEVSSKYSNRQLNSMFSKLKQSIVKVKKAIIGKSPTSKMISSEAKDEVKVK